MSTPEILSQKPLCMMEVKEEIEHIKKRDKELAFRTARTEEYLNYFVKKESLKLAESLRKMDMTRLKEEHIVKIVDTVPKFPEEVKTLLSGYTVTVSNESAKKIASEDDLASLS